MRKLFVEIAKLTPSFPLVAAWGARGGRGAVHYSVAGALFVPRTAWLASIAHGHLTSLAVTADGSPRHPLYVSGATPLQPYAGPTAAGPPVL